MKDSLLHSLCYVSSYYGQLNSPEALINGLPLQDGKLTPMLFSRAAEKAGLIAKENRTELRHIPSLILPVVLLLKEGESCVLIGFDADKKEAEIIVSSSDMLPISISVEDLESQYTGRYFLLKKKFRYDDRSPEILKKREGHWFWSTLFESKHIYRDVFLASILINIFAIATPMFTRLVYDKVVPNLAFESLWVLASGIFIVFIFDFVLKYLRGYFIDVAGKKSDVLISSKLFQKVLDRKSVV